MKRLISMLVCGLSACMAMGQEEAQAFRANLYNAEYEVFMRIDFYGESVTVPGNELYGQLPGFLGKKNNPFCWPITAAKLTDDNTAELSMINDFGSEDLTATLTRVNDSTYVLRQDKGSTLKVPKNGKWQKLPKTLPFTRQLQKR